MSSIKHAEHAAVALGAPELARELLLALPPVREAGEGVGVGELAHRAGGLLHRDHALLEVGEEVERGDRDGVREVGLQQHPEAADGQLAPEAREGVRQRDEREEDVDGGGVAQRTLAVEGDGAEHEHQREPQQGGDDGLDAATSAASR
jgi:hypothetical protein